MTERDHAPLRLPLAAWIDCAEGRRSAIEAVLGEQAEWGYAIPSVFRALTAPPELAILPAPPKAGDPHACALGYWTALLHVLLYSLGWARPERGLRWWYDTGKPVHEDARLRLLQIYDQDGMLDLFAAWLWADAYLNAVESLAALTGYQHDRAPIDVDRAWLAEQERAREPLGILSPYGGGSDPLHLSFHSCGPVEAPRGESVLLRSSRSDRTAVLLLDTMRGWYRALAEQGSTLPDIGDRSWRVDVVVRPIGTLGTYRRSRETGLWFAGRHRFHTRGT